MTRSFALAGGLALALAAALPAAAQTAGGSGQAGTDQQDGAGEGQATADRLTCAEIATMDTAVVPGTLYFIAGYREGQRASGMDDPGGATGLAGTGTGSEAGPSGRTGVGSEPGTGTAPDTATAQTGTAQTGTEGAGMGGHQVGRMSGYFEIPVEQVMRICAEAPERTVSDVVGEQGGEGSGGSN